MKTVPNFDRSKYDEMFSHGLSSGIGTTEKACVMACLNLACGGTLTDAAKSPCVLQDAASFAIRLNDAIWSSDKARANGLYDLGLAMLGTDGLDPKVFVSRLAEQTIRRVVPVFLRRAKLEDAARRCEEEGTADSAVAATSAASASAAAAGYAAATYAASAAASAAAASAAATSAGGVAYADYYDTGSAAGYAAYSAGAGGVGALENYGDETLILSARIATEILTEMKR